MRVLRSSCSYFHILKSFSFSVFIRNVHCTSRKNQAYVRLACRTYVRTHHKTDCLVYLCVAVSRVLGIMTQNESCDIRQFHVVELAVDSEQKLYSIFVTIPIKTIVIPVHYLVRDVIERVYRVISSGISHVVCKTSWLKRHSR